MSATRRRYDTETFVVDAFGALIALIIIGAVAGIGVLTVIATGLILWLSLVVAGTGLGRTAGRSAPERDR